MNQYSSKGNKNRIQKRNMCFVLYNIQICLDCIIWFVYLYSTIKNKNKPLIFFIMKAAFTYYSSVKPMPKQKTNIDLLFWFAYGSFCLMILGMAFGMDLLKLWLK